MKRKRKLVFKVSVVVIILCVLCYGFGRRGGNEQERIGPERGTTDVILTSMDFISSRSDAVLKEEIENFDIDKVSMIYIYIPEFTGDGMSFTITRKDYPEEMNRILSSIYGGKANKLRSQKNRKVTESVLFDYVWYFLLYDCDGNQLALVFQYSGEWMVYDGHIFGMPEGYEEDIRPCVLKLKGENQERLKSGEVTRRRVPVP